MIIFRYLNRELFKNFALISSLLGLIILSHLLSRLLQGVAGSGLAIAELAIAFITESSRFIAVLLPFSLYLAILLTYQRLYIDQELIALAAYGFSKRDLIRVSLPAISLIMLIVASLTNWFSPQLLTIGRRKLTTEGTAVLLRTLQAGRFQPLANNQGVLYVEQLSPDHRKLGRLFLVVPQRHLSFREDHGSMRNKPENQNASGILTAAKAYQWQDPETNALFLVAHDGYALLGLPGQNDYDLLQFKALKFQLSLARRSTYTSIDTHSTGMLWRHYHNPRCSAEYHWRLAIPLSTLFLALLAINLSAVRPRQGRYLNILAALLIYIIYLDLLLMGRNWIKTGLIPMHWGLWWAHGFCFMATIVSGLSQSSLWSRYRAMLPRQAASVIDSKG